MIVAKGTLCQATCCKSPPYRAQFDFEPRQPPLVMDGVVYLRSKCLPCLLRDEIGPYLEKHGIVMVERS